MIIQALIRLQACRTKMASVTEAFRTEHGPTVPHDRLAFVGLAEHCHGIAKGRIEYYEVEGSTWAHIRRILHLFDVMGYSQVREGTVEAHWKDIGTAQGRLTLLGKHPECLKAWDWRGAHGGSVLGCDAPSVATAPTQTVAGDTAAPTASGKAAFDRLVVEEHIRADAKMGRDWHSPYGCGCAHCRLARRGTPRMSGWARRGK